jgi:uncharacterized protein (TIGR03437 family)
MTLDRASKDLFVLAFLAFAAASHCAAQTYTLSDCKDGATLTVKIDSVISTTGPFQNNGGHSFNMIFFGDFTLAVNGSTHTYSSVVSSAGLNYTPTVGNLTEFLIESDDPSVRALGNLQAIGDLIPNATLPQTLPPISEWNNPTSDFIQYGNPTVTDYIDTLGTCTSGTGTATPAITNVISAGAFGGFNAITPGTWIEIYGTNLAPDTRQWTTSDFNGQTAPTSLDRVQVTVNGQNAYLSYISSNPGQINAQVPYTIPINQKVQLIVNNNGVLSAPYDVTSNGIQPGLLAPASFKIGANQYVTALSADGATYILPTGAIPGVASRPAKPNETITLYGIGFGLVSPPTAAGEIAPGSTRTLLPLQISFDQTPAEITYAGLAPGFVGLYQFDVVVPSIPDNDVVPLKLTLDTVAGAQTLYIPVHQ